MKWPQKRYRREIIIIPPRFGLGKAEARGPLLRPHKGHAAVTVAAVDQEPVLARERLVEPGDPIRGMHGHSTWSQHMVKHATETMWW